MRNMIERYGYWLTALLLIAFTILEYKVLEKQKEKQKQKSETTKSRPFFILSFLTMQKGKPHLRIRALLPLKARARG